MATTNSQPSLDGPSKTGNCQVSWLVNNGYISLNGVAVQAFVRSITLPRFRHYVDNIPYTSPTGVSSNAARYPGLSSGGKSSHIYFVSAFMCCNFQVDL